MTVADLIAKLQTMDPDAEAGRGYTQGSGVALIHEVHEKTFSGRKFVVIR